jgi:hypothetical protein
MVVPFGKQTKLSQLIFGFCRSTIECSMSSLLEPVMFSWEIGCPDKILILLETFLLSDYFLFGLLKCQNQTNRIDPDQVHQTLFCTRWRQQHVLLKKQYFKGDASHSASAHWTTNNFFNEEEITQSLKYCFTNLFYMSIFICNKTNILHEDNQPTQQILYQPQAEYWVRPQWQACSMVL